MLPEKKNNLLPFEHNYMMEDNLVKKAQKIINSNGDKLSHQIYNTMIKSYMENLPIIESVSKSIIEYNEDDYWDAFSGDDIMEYKIKGFINALKENNTIEKAITYRNNDSNVVWFVLKEETHENSIRCIKEIKQYIDDKNIEFEYFLCDLEDENDIKEDLELAKVKYEVI